MKDMARVANHPIHPMLIPFPIGLWIFSLAADIIYRAGGSDAWLDVAYYSMAGGIVGALAAALPGFIDFFAMKPSATKRIALWHMLLNVTALVLFIINLALRGNAPDGGLPFFLSIIGAVLLIVSGWLGGHMVYVHGMAVDETEVCPVHSGVHAHETKV